MSLSGDFTMRFLDANVFIYAYYKPTHELTEKERQMKEYAKDDYLGAIEMMSELKMDPNDCLAVEVMGSENVNEIYFFDKGFGDVLWIKRVP